MTRTMIILAVETVALAGVLTLSLDLREHGRVAPLGGVNEWGYRGSVAQQRKPHEIRIAIVGGTRAFGWGVPASALVTEVSRAVKLTTDRPGAEVRPVVAINLGRLGALPEAYPEIIEHFSYLQPDYICLYDDLGVSGGSPTWGTDGTSGVYALTGYAPALPLVLREKGMALRVGDVRLAYAPTVRQGPRPSLVHRAAGATLEAAGWTLAAADQRLSDWVLRNRPARPPVSYVDAMMAAIEAAKLRARGVVVVTSPADTAEQANNLRALRARLDARAGSAPWLRLVNFSDDPALARDPELRLDGWNFSSAGIARVAGTIAPALLSLIAS